MASRQVTMSQEAFMRQGGVFVHALMAKREKGELIEEGAYQFQEYPKMVRISQGVQDIPRSTETVDKKIREWTERKEVFQDVIVHSEEEEERVLSGGATSAAAEEERQGMIARGRSMGMKIDPSWSIIRLRRELGEKLDAPEPVDNMAALEAELSRLKQMAAMKAEIEALKAQLVAPAEPVVADVEDLRGQLADLGVVFDRRWGAARLQQAVDEATAPAVAA